MRLRFGAVRYGAVQFPIIQYNTGLLDRLAIGGNVIVAEGYLLEFERRGYLKSGAFVPEVVLEHPDLVRQLHEEFVHAGSDVVLAFTVGKEIYPMHGKTHSTFSG